MKYPVGIVILLMAISGCSISFENEKDFFSWQGDSKNGMVVSKVSGDKEISIKYLPTGYLVYSETREFENPDQMLIDSISDLYDSTRTFLLTIRNKNEKEDYDIMYEDVSNYKEYSDKNLTMNFEMNQLLSLGTKEGNRYNPVLASVENTYGLQKHKNFYLVFAPLDDSQMDILTSDELDIVFTDEVFHTGIHHFVFRKENLDTKIEFNFL